MAAQSKKACRAHHLAVSAARLASGSPIRATNMHVQRLNAACSGTAAPLGMARCGPVASADKSEVRRSHLSGKKGRLLRAIIQKPLQVAAPVSACRKIEWTRTFFDGSSTDLHAIDLPQYATQDAIPLSEFFVNSIYTRACGSSAAVSAEARAGEGVSRAEHSDLVGQTACGCNGRTQFKTEQASWQLHQDGARS